MKKKKKTKQKNKTKNKNKTKQNKTKTKQQQQQSPLLIFIPFPLPFPIFNLIPFKCSFFSFSLFPLSSFPSSPCSVTPLSTTELRVTVYTNLYIQWALAVWPTQGSNSQPWDQWRTTGGVGVGGRVSPETSNLEISADLPEKREKGWKLRRKKENCKREGGKVTKGGGDLFFFFFFCFYFSKPLKFVLGLPKWKFSTGKKHFTPGKNQENDFAPSEKFFSCYAPAWDHDSRVHCFYQCHWASCCNDTYKSLQTCIFSGPLQYPRWTWWMKNKTEIKSIQ